MLSCMFYVLLILYTSGLPCTEAVYNKIHVNLYIPLIVALKKKKIVAYCLDMKAGSFSEYCQPFLFPRPQELQASTSGFASDLISHL